MKKREKDQKKKQKQIEIKSQYRSFPSFTSFSQLSPQPVLWAWQDFKKVLKFLPPPPQPVYHRFSCEKARKRSKIKTETDRDQVAASQFCKVLQAFPTSPPNQFCEFHKILKLQICSILKFFHTSPPNQFCEFHKRLKV